MTLQGTILGKYRILSRLGEGGMGTVYRAHDELLDRDVAIKVLRADLASQHALVERFRSEAIALARLGHPRIAMLHGLERDGEQFLMIMEFVTGETLELMIQRGGPIPWRRAAEYAAAVCDALEHAHEQGVVHRDIKPANIMVTRGGHIKVMDFGIARVMGRSRQTQLGRSVGTPMYMAPEQLRGEEVDGRSDIYALGAVLYEMITGKLAFDADSDYSLMMKQLNEPPPRPGLMIAGIPGSVDEIVTTAMAKRREDRFPNAAAMRGFLQGVLRDVPPEPVEAPKATRLADAPIPGAVPATRLGSTAPSVPATRLGDEPRMAPETRLAEPAGRPGWQKWVADWRVWAVAAGVLLVSTVAVRAGHRTGQSTGATPPAPPTVEPLPPPAPLAAAPAPPPQPVQDPRLIGARPVSPSRDDPSPRRGMGPSEPAPAPAPPTPVPLAPVPPATAPTGRSGASFERGEVVSAVSAWLAGIGSKDVSRLSGLSSDSKEHSKLLELVRDGRVSVSDQESPQIEPRESGVLVTVGTTLTTRSPFGATRKTPVRFALELVRQGNGWHVARARMLGTPKLD